MFNTYISPSTFSILPTDYSEQKNENKWFSQKVNNFSKLIESRIEYTKGLKNLPAVWISGKSEKPDDFSIKKTQEILRAFQNFIVDSYHIYENKKEKEKDSKPTVFDISDNIFRVPIQIPKLVMAPIPSGGIEIELYKNPNDSFFISIPNKNQLASIEKQVNGFFEDVSISSNNIAGVLIDEYRALSWL